MMAAVCKVTVIIAFMAAMVRAIDVNVTGEWKPEQGWEVACSWLTPANDALQSVSLSLNEQQFMVYRPENHGSARYAVFPSSDMIMAVNCTMLSYRGQEGQCVLLLVPLQPPDANYTYTCEVSGERPFFRIGRKDYVIRAFVPPSDAILISNKQDASSPNRVMMNCSSTGLPAPSLSWTVGDDKVQADFTGRTWNQASKLWHVWSYLSYTRNDNSKVLCSPEVASDNEVIRGKPAEYNSASSWSLFGSKLIAVLLVLHLVS